jgi:hypothetical protein
MYAIYVNRHCAVDTCRILFISVFHERNHYRTNHHAIPKSLVDEIDDYRFGHRIPPRAAAIRRLLELGLTHATGKGEAAKQGPPGNYRRKKQKRRKK